MVDSPPCNRFLRHAEDDTARFILCDCRITSYNVCYTKLLRLLHQGSKIIVETIAAKLSIPLEKVPYGIHDYGNTISSTIPLLLQDELDGLSSSIAMTGFGVGLSWSSGLLFRR